MLVSSNELTLSEALREATLTLHTKAERSGVINDILRKKSDKRSYAMLLRNLLPAYQAMENAIGRQARHPAFRVFAKSGLQRADRMSADLADLSGDDWRRDLPLLPAGQKYAERIEDAGQGNGIRLIAHAYVRYFGDLSGGQILKRLLSKTLNLPDSSLSFYDFPEISDPESFKAEMRNAIDLDTAKLADKDIIIEEGKKAFEHNIEVSEAIQGLVAS